MVEGIRSGLAVVQMRRWYPFGVAVGVFAGGESAVLDEPVVRATSQGEVVDVGAVGGLPALDVMDLAVVGGRIAAGLRAATVVGMNVPTVHPRQDA